MPPKGKKGAVADKAKDLQDTEDPLQAVVSLHISLQYILSVPADSSRGARRLFRNTVPSLYFTATSSPYIFRSPPAYTLNLTMQCLLPLVNVPLIEYTLEFLANCGVDEVYVYCGAHTDQIEQYLQYISPPV